jgi:hypothetical protein
MAMLSTLSKVMSPVYGAVYTYDFTYESAFESAYDLLQIRFLVQYESVPILNW